MSKYVVYQNKDQTYRFELIAPNGQVICTSRKYNSVAGVFNGIASVQLNSQTETIVKDYENKSTK